MPGAAYCELATAAAGTLLKIAPAPAALTTSTIAAPLKLPESSAADCTMLTAEAELATGNMIIRSAVRKESSSKVAGAIHLAGTIVKVVAALERATQRETVKSTLALSTDAARAACRDSCGTSGVYSRLASAGLQYGSEFR